MRQPAATLISRGLVIGIKRPIPEEKQTETLQWRLVCLQFQDQSALKVCAGGEGDGRFRLSRGCCRVSIQPRCQIVRSNGTSNVRSWDKFMTLWSSTGLPPGSTSRDRDEYDDPDRPQTEKPTGEGLANPGGRPFPFNLGCGSGFVNRIRKFSWARPMGSDSKFCGRQ